MISQGTRVKICGVTSLDDAQMCVELGAESLGLNFWEGSPRACSRDVARQVVDALGNAVRIVAVVVDFDEAQTRLLLQETGIDIVQFHGREAPELVQAFLPNAYKAVGVPASIAQSPTGPLSAAASAETAVDTARLKQLQAEAARFPSDEILLDATVPGLPGGTGKRFDWRLAAEIAKHRKVTLAGGLRAGNVAEAIEVARPYRVDVASGVETEPGKKDRDKVRAFVESARRAFG